MSTKQYKTYQLTITKSYVSCESNRIEMGDIIDISQPLYDFRWMIAGIGLAILTFVLWDVFGQAAIILIGLALLIFIVGFIPPQAVDVSLNNGTSYRIDLSQEQDFKHAIATLRLNLEEYRDKPSPNYEYPITPSASSLYVNPEEYVRGYVLNLLTSEFRFSASDIECEFPITLGSSRKRADIVVFLPNETHIQSHIYIIIECKRMDRRDDSGAKRQLESYFAACINARYGVTATYRWRVFEKINQAGRFDYMEIEALVDSSGISRHISYEPDKNATFM